MIRAGEAPEDARSVLLLSLKTEMIYTANVREWRYIFSQRASEPAHHTLRGVMLDLLKQFQSKYPVLFDDIEGVNNANR